MRIVFFGTPNFVVPIATSLSRHFDIIGVVTAPDVPVGRKKTITPSPVKKWYMGYLLRENKEGIILTPEKLTEDVTIKLRKLHADVFITAAYGKLIPRNILEIPKHGALNIHPSSLPEYRGPSPIQNAILDGKDELGISIMKMDEKLDHGPIVDQWGIPIIPTDTSESLLKKAFTHAAEKLPSLINKYANGALTPQEQNHNKATYTKHITKQDGFIDMSQTEKMSSLEIENWKLEIARKIRAYYPWPTAYTKLKVKNEELKIVKFLPEKKVQIEGGKPLSVKDFANGYPELKETIQNLLEKRTT